MTAIFRIYTLFCFFSVSTLAADNSQFPRPAELESDINFWIAVFSEYTSDQGVLHDNRDLTVIYEQLDIPANISRRDRHRRAGARRENYQSILSILANGKRDKLTAEEKRVLALWPADVKNKTLQDAIDQIRYQQGLSDRFRIGLVQAGLYRNHINSQFTRLHVPIELAALPHIESSYNPNARSHVGASGIWQFTRSTGRRFLQVDHVLDERNDPYSATEAAGKLLAYNYSITGNWPMAITAYNHGLSGVRRAMHKFGDREYVRIFREYRSRIFGFASRNFYVAFLAAMQIDQNVEQYFPGIVPEQPIDYVIAELPAYISADVIAKSLGVSRTDLKRHNPALQSTIWQGSKNLPKDYRLRMPRNLLKAPISQLIAALPVDELFTQQLPDLFHTVVRGDTLSEIAAEYKTKVSILAALNDLDGWNYIRVGQRLRLPAAGPASTTVTAKSTKKVVEPQVIVAIADKPAIADTSESAEISTHAVAEKFATTIRGATQTTLLSDPSDYSVAADNTIEIQPLETLGHYGDWLDIKTQRLRDINGIGFHSPVVVGQRVKLDMSYVDVKAFENFRMTYHRQQQDNFFRNHTISGVKEHVVKKNESVWVLALRQYDVPIWLFRQYNPKLDLHRIRSGTRVRFPILIRGDG
jgi:membrane-bound lytic murein transglycosylase D